jgi:hypothetical protein
MLNRIFEIAIAASIAAAASGQLPRLIHTVQRSELSILEESKSSKWGHPFMLPIHHPKGSRGTRPPEVLPQNLKL